MTHCSQSDRESHPLTPVLRIHIPTDKMQNSQECSTVLAVLEAQVVPLSFARALILHNIKLILQLPQTVL